MPAMQMQKTRLAATTTKTAITQRQSIEMVQTLLHGGLSSLAYLRSFFPEKAFSGQIYEMSSRVSYRDYADGKPTKRSSVSQTNMQVLRRGRSQRANLFLDWLEKVAFVALKNGTLRALQIYVHVDPELREKVIETYTFTINYHTNKEGRTITGLKITSPQGDGPPLTVEATNQALQDMLREIMQTCTHLPELPKERYVSMTLHYMPDDDEEYLPTGFEPSASSQLRFGTAEGWERRTFTVEKELRSAFHSATLQVNHLHQPAFNDMAGIMQPTGIPEQLEFNDIITAKAEPGDDAATITPSTVALSDLDNVGDSGLTPAPTSETKTIISQSPAMASENGDTQTSNVPRIKSALQGLMLPERLTQGDTQTQRLMRPPPPPKETLASKKAPVQEATASAKMALLPQIAATLKSQQTKLHQAALKLAKPSGLREKGADTVLCQCGHLNEESGEMIGCSYCDTWQHFHCYGFTGPTDPRVPDDHACYQCVLAGRDEGALSTLKDLAVKRRGMSFALRIGLWRKGNLAKVMDLPLDVGQGIHDYLRTEGFVVNVYKSHKPGFAATGKPLFIPVTEGSNHDRLIQDLFNPLLHIEKYYAPIRPTPTEFIGQQLYALRPADMPAPATPLQKKKATATPASNLDLRPSMTPYETPVRAHFPPPKRSLEDQDIFDTPAKRHATGTPLYRRLKSIQTSMILNANGMSSSPAINNR